MAPDTVRLEEVLHGGGDFHDMCFQREMSGIEELNLGSRNIFPKRFRSYRNEEGIVLAPNRQQRRLRLAEIFLKLRIKLQIRGVVQKQIELDFFIPRALEKCRVERIRLWRNTLRIRDTLGVLPARTPCRQNALSEYVPVFGRGRCPVFPDRTPGVAQTFFVLITILRDNSGHPVRMSHRDTESGWRTVVEYIDRKPIELQGLHEGVNRQRQLVECVFIFPLGWNLCESEPR